MKKSKKTNDRALTFMLIAVAVMATIGVGVLWFTMIKYCAIRDNYQFAAENAAARGFWTDGLTSSANSAKEALAEYAKMNWFAGLLYSLNGTFTKKLLQLVVIFGTLAFGVTVAIFDCVLVYAIIKEIQEKICKLVDMILDIFSNRGNHHKGHHQSQSQKNNQHKNGKIASIDEFRRRA